jgi:hypothetical protein
MDFSRTIALSAAGGLVLGLAACGGGGQAPAEEPGADSVADADGATMGKKCCRGRNVCAGKGGCMVKGSHDCKGGNKCRGQGGCETGQCPPEGEAASTAAPTAAPTSAPTAAPTAAPKVGE